MYKPIMHNRMNVLGFLPKPRDKNPARAKLWQKMLVRGMNTFMKQIADEARANNARVSAVTVFDTPQKTMTQLPKEEQIDLLVYFIDKVDPRLAIEITPLLFENRMKSLLVLSKMRVDWDAPWLQNFSTLPTRAVKDTSGIFIAKDYEIPASQFQIRELDHYKRSDIQLLLKQLLSAREE